MGKYIGKSFAFEFAIAAENSVPTALTYVPLGAMRDKSIKFSWDTADATADDSPAATKEQIATFKSVEISGSGVSRGTERPNQDTLEAHINTPSAVTGGQPCVWLRLTHPSGKRYYGYFMVSEFSTDAPYADVITWSMTANSNGAVTITP
ncbi:phage tail tube protein [Pseudacidovorax intermedius]|uniref:Phage tail protein n=1 Tax=Pseudacidovorax intermedius TaxID=433924 RepID=A0A147GR08_9BURK|nr:phage tail tube protein [Pseudacidovorax intermedius]KTT17964.1 hypothetical protein NS331_16530 [Pseudacidovorax intermedius]